MARTTYHRLLALACTAFCLATAGYLIADDQSPTAEQIEFFEAKIRPVLVQNCYECHSAKSGRSESGLKLDSRDAVRTGGDRGPAVVPEKPDESILLEAIAHTDPDLTMPPKKKPLSKDVVQDFRKWIAMGAPDPREGTATAGPPVDIETGRKFWAYQKPVAHPAPATRHPDWARRKLDRFILAKLESAGLSFTPDAHPATLLRRLHFDLIGLPPSPKSVERFMERISEVGLDAALEQEVDVLLASPQFGERWGRHWLDVARFAESSGKESNISFPYAFRYRDYVIDCFNADKPYDEFLTEQIAGDLLPYDHPKERARLLIATGFLALGPKNLDAANKLQFFADVVDEQIDSVSRAVLANSVACARCHDHKFDPFSMEDYYALAGVFASTQTFFGTAVSPANRIGGDPLILPRDAGVPIYHHGIPAERVQKLKDELAALQKEEKEGRAAVMKAIKAGRDPEGIFTLRDALRIFWKSGGIEGQLEKVDENGKPLPLAMGVLERDRMIDVPLLAGGDISKPGEKIPRGFPRVIEISATTKIPDDQSGRLQFARWLTSPDNPLTARVMVNRIWHDLFGSGIVKSVDNFGFRGDLPSHPELLDDLSVRFIENGWSIKSMVKEIVLSRTYRQASTFNAKSFRADPENRLHWRADKRRLDAEAIRDAMLAVSGDLDLSRPEGSLVARTIGDRPISLIGLDSRIPADLDDSVHRSVYLPVLRDRLPDVLDLFDFAEPSLVTGDRETTNVPVQALYLMNSPFVQARAQSLADRLLREAPDDGHRIRRAYSLCFSRYPAPDEYRIAQEYLARGQNVSGDKETYRKTLFVSFCQALLATAEFRNLD